MTQATDRDNSNQDEISKFSLQSAHWWDPLGKLKTLHQINPLRLEIIDRHHALPEQKVLDVGCGGGILSEAMARQGARVTAIDLSEPLLQVARQHATENNVMVDYQCSTAEHWASMENNRAAYDLVTCMEMLEHVPNPAGVIQSCACMLRPGGTVVFSTLNRTLAAWLKAIVAAEHLLRMLPRGTHQHSTFIRPSELSRWSRAAGLQLEALYGIDYSPLSDRFSLSRKVDVNYLAVFSKPSESS